ncbi:MAG TPA: DUF3489 domain-containing protein [Hyphomicrobiaceae bacterium]|nr:DUF3489 domain-containing protein [Hyphomicrobiaceae bacterium]
MTTISKTRATSKIDLLIKRLQRPSGATLLELAKVTGWQPHSVRGAMAGALRKKGIAVASEKSDGIRRYRIAVPTSDA